MTKLDTLITITDPRQPNKIKRKLEDILITTICAVLSGANTWDDVIDWACTKQEWLEQYVEFENGLPSHDTFNRVFSMIDGKELEKLFIEWTNTIKENHPQEVIAIDGKTIRGSRYKGEKKSKIHLVSAWASENGLVLGQVKVSEKSNEITAIPELLNLLDIKNKVITIDAMGTQKNIAKEIKGLKGEYILSLKGNQKTLLEDVSYFFEEELKNNSSIFSFSQTIEKSHGRIETRKCYVSDEIDWISSKDEWLGLKSIIMIESTREIDGVKSTEKRYYISSLSKEFDMMLPRIRKHWGIENCLHWALDVSFKEDKSRIRSGNAAENLGLVRKICLNLLRKEKSFKGSLERKRKKAGWDNEYLEKILFG